MFPFLIVGAPFNFETFTFGTNRIQRTNVVVNTHTIDVKTNLAVGFSGGKTKVTGTQRAHTITMLYTQNPMYLESLREGTLMCLVSHARKVPRANRAPLLMY